MPSLNLKTNPHGGTAKKITSSPYKKFVEATQKKKIKEATKSKTSWLVSNALLGPPKRWKRTVCQDQTSSDTSSDSDNDLAVPFVGDLMEKDEEKDSVRIVSLKTTMETTRYNVQNVSDGRTHFVLVWRKILFVSLSGINTVLFLVCILCICVFFVCFVTILCVFFVNYYSSS